MSPILDYIFKVQINGQMTNFHQLKNVLDRDSDGDINADLITHRLSPSYDGVLSCIKTGKREVGYM